MLVANSRIGVRFLARNARRTLLRGCADAVPQETAQQAVSEVPPKPRSSSDPLTDTFGRKHTYLRISVAEKCNLRCVYCMPEEGVKLSPREAMFSEEEMVKVIQLFSKLGINKLRFTGGEPTLRKDLCDVIRTVRDTTNIRTIGMTTNGVQLRGMISRLVDAGLTHVNISLDTLEREKFQEITRRDAFRSVLSSIYHAATSGLVVKINAVVIRGVNDMEIPRFIDLAAETNVAVRFIELMPFDDNNWDTKKFVSYAEMLDRLKDAGYHYSKDAPKDPSDTTKWYTVTDSQGAKQAKLGFITSMSEHFCGGCNRLRITADGKLKTCLFGDETLSLRDSMRAGDTDEQLTAKIAASVRKKHFKHGGHSDIEHLAAAKNRPMILIGG